MSEASIMKRWEDSYLTPPDPKAENPCFECYDEAEVYVEGKPLCMRCAEEDYKDYRIERPCDICGEDEAYFKVGSTVYCEYCFREVFRL